MRKVRVLRSNLVAEQEGWEIEGVKEGGPIEIFEAKTVGKKEGRKKRFRDCEILAGHTF